MEVLLLLLVSFVAAQPYDVSAMEGDDACNPACMNGGLCENSICFCKSPYSGDYCEDTLSVTPRLSIILFIVLLLVFLVVGFLSAFVIKFVYDLCCIRMPEAPEEDEDIWPLDEK